MQFNVGKFNILKLRQNQDLKIDYNYVAPGNDQVITDNTVVRDLGVLVNCEANYMDHIAKIYSKLLQRAGLLLRTLRTDH